MPVLPFVRAADTHQAIDLAVEAEHGYRHTAVMYSRDLDALHRMARAFDGSIFVKNAPSVAGLGYGGEGFTSFTIASPTGDGLTTARTFTRERRCTLAGYFRIV
jgi:acyl-CoA reductase-like NAD-dependent aldehyde dehydrogenase